MTRIILLLTIVTLASCAPLPYTKPGATAQDFITDKYACMRDVSQSQLGLFAGKSLAAECMNAHGWYQHEADGSMMVN